MKVKVYVVSKTVIDPRNGDVVFCGSMDPEADQITAISKMREAYLSVLQERNLADNGGCDREGNGIPGGCFADTEAAIYDYAEFAFGQLLELVSFTCREHIVDVPVPGESKEELYSLVERARLKDYAADYLLRMIFEIEPEDYPDHAEREKLLFADYECTRIWGKPLKDILSGDMPEIGAVVEKYLAEYKDGVSRMEQFDTLFVRMFAKKKYRHIEMQRIAGNEFISVFGCSDEDYESVLNDCSMASCEKADSTLLKIKDSSGNYITQVRRQNGNVPEWLMRITAEGVSNKEVATQLAEHLNENIRKRRDAQWDVLMKHQIGDYDVIWRTVVEAQEREPVKKE